MTEEDVRNDRENAGATDDGEADDNEEINDEIDKTTITGEMSGQSSLKLRIRSFLELFAIEKNKLILTLIKDADWDKNKMFWTFVYKEKPLRNYDTVRNIFSYMNKLIQETYWNENNSDTLEKAIFDQSKISKQIIKAMCLATRVEFIEKEKEINFFELLEELVKLGKVYL